MRMLVPALAALLSQLLPTLSPAQSRGPQDRQVTDPASISSATDPKAHAAPIDDLYYTRLLGAAAWSPDGRQIAFTINMSGRPNLWKVAAQGGWPLQLVQSDERQVDAAWSPDGKWIAFQQDSGGNELWDVLAVPSDGGAVVNLTNTPDVREESPRWSPDGRTIALNVKKKDGTSYDLALLDWATHRVTMLTHEADSSRTWSSVAWSADGNTLYADRARIGFDDSDVYAVDVRSGAATNLTQHEGKKLYQAASLSPDGKTLLITSNEKDGYQNVALLDIASHKRTWVSDTHWEAAAGDFAPDGKSFTYTINADGVTNAYLVDAASLRAKRIGTGSGMTTFPAPNSFAPTGGRLLIARESTVQPRDLWIYETATGKTRRLTQSAIASLSSTPLPPTQVVHYRSFDGKIISALMWVPFNLKRDGTNPAIVLPHGGPTGQTVDLWSPRVAALVSRGYICIAPNVRGSTGYGADFQRANYQDLGGGDLQDEVYATRFLQATGYVDAKKIGITGGSYGGFMTLMAIGRTPDVWAAAVQLYGIIDWRTMLEHSDPLLQQYEKSLLGDPVKDREVYEKDSPITYIHAVRTPLLVLQGDNDPRVPKEEAVQVVDLLNKDGKTVAAHYYPDEGHGFNKRDNQIDSIRRTVDWFDKYLKGGR
ncbi:MAG TPA: S9 family peptidase [Steroidobacteraceae bacterium]|nr:S9 family peptidase [Steroidobacteraceae bacterium]